LSIATANYKAYVYGYFEEGERKFFAYIEVAVPEAGKWMHMRGFREKSWISKKLLEAGKKLHMLAEGGENGLLRSLAARPPHYYYIIH
jgi:hypothetical protein